MKIVEAGAADVMVLVTMMGGGVVYTVEAASVDVTTVVEGGPTAVVCASTNSVMVVEILTTEVETEVEDAVMVTVVVALICLEINVVRVVVVVDVLNFVTSVAHAALEHPHVEVVMSARLFNGVGVPMSV